jgi:hypothetical protein
VNLYPVYICTGLSLLHGPTVTWHYLETRRSVNKCVRFRDAPNSGMVDSHAQMDSLHEQALGRCRKLVKWFRLCIYVQRKEL